MPRRSPRESRPPQGSSGTLGSPAAASAGAVSGTAARFIERERPDLRAGSAGTSPRGPQLPDARQPLPRPARPSSAPASPEPSAAEEGAGLIASWRGWRAEKDRSGTGEVLMPEFQLDCSATGNQKAPRGDLSWKAACMKGAAAASAPGAQVGGAREVSFVEEEALTRTRDAGV
ncbi:hypothetical protein T484DRAFT_1913228 [Baffinella frigidus]|nr:hypothetical protein T484DRAFT_1913228 [Cryptophyta sp. CCMP2293]